ncbi:hypothetical protein BJY52DRAFT_1229877 [Lactarius psammicola]|nr:hypothetical protein BJY52DRAFT_1229877 [Lactarius psammicola]
MVAALAVVRAKVRAKVHAKVRTKELEILQGLQTFNSHQNHTIQLLHVIHSDSTPGDILVMPWQSLLDSFLTGCNNMIALLRNQLLEGCLVPTRTRNCSPRLEARKYPRRLYGCVVVPPKIIDYRLGISIHVEGEETLVKGYRGTPGWSAPEVGTEYGTPKEYSAIRADLWSCGQLLWHIGWSCLGDNTSTFASIYNRLLSPEPRSRPLLGEVFDSLHCVMMAGKRRSDADGALVMQKLSRLSEGSHVSSEQVHLTALASL